MKMKKICLFSLFRQKKSVNEDLSLLIQISSPKTTECTFYLWYSNFYFYCLNVHSLFKVWNLSSLTETNLFWPECVLFFWAGLFLPLWFTIFSAWIGVFMFLKKQTGTHLALHVAVSPADQVQSAAGASDKEWLMFLLLFPPSDTLAWHLQGWICDSYVKAVL